MEKAERKPVSFKKLNLDLESSYHRTRPSLYTQKEAKEQIKKDEMILLNDESSSKKVYLRADRSYPLCSFQFYDENGNLIMTFPWNKTDHPNKIDLEIEGSNIILKNLKVSATDKGRIAIETVYDSSLSDLILSDAKETFIFDENGKKPKVGGAIDTSGYPNKGVFDHEAKYGLKDPVKLFASEEGDKVFDYCLKDTKNRYIC